MNPLSLYATLTSLAVLTVACIGCQAETSCAQTRDCFKGQLCLDRVCVDEADAPEPWATDMSASQDMPVVTDATSDQSQAISCLNPQGDVCAEDAQEKELKFDYRIKPEAWHYVGCKGVGDMEIISLDTSLDGVLCRGDNAADVYSVEFARCRNVTYDIIMTLTIDSTCEPSNYEVKWTSLCEGEFVCKDERVAPNVYRRTLTIPRVSSAVPTNLMNISLLPKRAGVELEYRLDVQTKKR